MKTRKQLLIESLLKESDLKITTKKTQSTAELQKFDIFIDKTKVGEIQGVYKQTAPKGSRSTDFSKWKWKWNYVGIWDKQALLTIDNSIDPKDKMWGMEQSTSPNYVIDGMIATFKMMTGTLLKK